MRKFRFGTYYSTKLDQFVQVRAIYKDGYACGGFTGYYSDSTTNICVQRLSGKYLQSLSLVRVKNIDQLGHGVKHNDIGWVTQSGRTL